MFDYSKMRGKIREKFGTQNAFAEAMEFSSATLSDMLKKKIEVGVLPVLPMTIEQ